MKWLLALCFAAGIVILVIAFFRRKPEYEEETRGITRPGIRYERRMTEAPAPDRYVSEVKAQTKKWGMKKEVPRARQMLSNRERKMFFRLNEAFKQQDFVVVPQVAFSALITSENWGLRNKFNRRVADFVLCNEYLEVLAVIELDDSSHIGKELKDRERDALLINAGYAVLRYPKIPEASKLISDIRSLTG